MTVIVGSPDCSTPSSLSNRIFNNLKYDNPWQAKAPVKVGALICPKTPNGFGYKCTSITGTGTTGVSEPSWSLVLNGTTTDNLGANQVVWTTEDVANPSGQNGTTKPFHSVAQFGYPYIDDELDGLRYLAYNMAKGIVDSANTEKWDGTTQVSGSVAVVVPWSLATPPASPDAINDEFNGSGAAGTLPTGWTTVSHTPSTTAIDFTSAPAGSGSDFWRCDYGGSRPGWFRMQGRNGTGGSANEGIKKSITANTNDVFVIRAEWDTFVSGGIGQISLVLSDSVSGHVFGISQSSSGLTPSVAITEMWWEDPGFTSTTISDATNTQGQWYNIPEYLCIVKKGLSFYAFLGQGGSWVGFSGTALHTFTTMNVDTVQIWCATLGATAGGLGPICGVDFFRRYPNTLNKP